MLYFGDYGKKSIITGTCFQVKKDGKAPRDQVGTSPDKKEEEVVRVFNHSRIMENTTHKIAVFGGGCFWCTEAIFLSLKGVFAVMPGYTGGHVENPTYEQVCRGTTGHVESIQIEFDPAIISFNDLLTVFFNTHDPTTPNRQGNDVGEQYASTIFYADLDQKSAADVFIAELNAGKAYDMPVITAVRKLEKFFPAEDYHRNYYETHKDAPYCQLIIEPKIEKFQKRFAELLK